MITDIFIFLLALHLTMQLVASLYRIVDLWYRIGDFFLPIARSVISYALIMALLCWYLEGSKESAFLWGCLSFLVFHVSIFWIGQAMFKVKCWHQESDK